MRNLLLRHAFGAAMGIHAAALVAVSGHPPVPPPHGNQGASTPLVEMTWISLDAPQSHHELLVRPRSPRIREWFATNQFQLRGEQRLLGVYAVAPGTEWNAELPAMQGDYRLTSKSLRFIPAFELQSGVNYVAIFSAPAEAFAGAAARETTFTFRMPERKRPRTTRVTQIHPTAAVLPENLLKFYLHFSAPMSRGHIYNFIHLRKQSGTEIELPFLEIDEELWNPELTRLTLFIDPGRIKRGVRPLEEIGPALEAGGSYELVIDAGWKDASGNPLRSGFTKRFRVGPADRQPVDPKQWVLLTPRSGTRDRLRIQFPEPLDAALLQHCLEVIDAEGRTVQGRIAVGAEERSWEFRPSSPWLAADLALRVKGTLEDLAGNNIGKAFDVDLFDRVRPDSPRSSLLIPFKPSTGKRASMPPEWRRPELPVRGG